MLRPANQEGHALAGLSGRSSSRVLADDDGTSSTGSGGGGAGPAEATPPHRLLLPNLAPGSSPRAQQRGQWEATGRGSPNGREATSNLARRMSEEVTPQARSGFAASATAFADAQPSQR